MKRLFTFIAALLFALPVSAFAASTVSVLNLGTMRFSGSPGVRAVQWDWACDGATTASDSTQTATLTGRIVGVRAKDPNNDIGTAYTVKILDSAGHDVLQGVGSDTEFGADPTADSEFRVPVDSTHGGYIWLWNEPVYLDISSAADGDSGRIILYIQLP